MINGNILSNCFRQCSYLLRLTLLLEFYCSMIFHLPYLYLNNDVTDCCSISVCDSDVTRFSGFPSQVYQGRVLINLERAARIINTRHATRHPNAIFHDR